ncbi:unnamed protein product, partial [Heterotrigona itama]
IFTGLRAIRLFQINGAIGNERGSEGHGNHGSLLGTTNPDFLVPCSSSSHRIASHRIASRPHALYYQYDLVLLASVSSRPFNGSIFLNARSKLPDSFPERDEVHVEFKNCWLKNRITRILNFTSLLNRS